MRVDGTLMGMDEDSKKMIPQWRRGHFSMLFDASAQPAQLYICDHQKKLFASMAKKKKARDMDAEVCISARLCITADKCLFKCHPVHKSRTCHRLFSCCM